MINTHNASKLCSATLTLFKMTVLFPIRPETLDPSPLPDYWYIQ